MTGDKVVKVFQTADTLADYGVVPRMISMSDILAQEYAHRLNAVCAAAEVSKAVAGFLQEQEP